MTNLTIRELTAEDIADIANYWLDSEPAFLESLGVDLAKLPSREELTGALHAQLAKPIEERQSYCLIGEADGRAIGHCNTNPTTFGEEAWMHLHLWRPDARRRGLGTRLVRESVKRFFEALHLKRLYSEPMSSNEAPNRTLAKLGFELVKEYVTVPGSICYEQSVKLWLMTRERFAATGP